MRKITVSIRSAFINHTRAERLSAAGLGILRYGLVALLLLWGSMKFFDFEAQAIRPLIENHPLMSWMYAVFGVRGSSALIGIVELVACALIALRRCRPVLSALGSLSAAGTFVVTLSFLLTTPGALAPDSPFGGFLMKDIILLGAALITAAEALGASERVESGTSAALASHTMTTSNDQTNTAPPKAGTREWLGLAVLALPCMLYSMDLTVLNLAVPHVTVALEPTSTELLWIIDIYGFLVAGLLITMGTLGDRIGRRKLLLIGALAFGVCSVLAAFSTSAEMLIATRAALGVAAATLAPSTLSLLRNMFHDPKERTLAVGIWIMSFSLGAVIGPMVGGALLERFWWGSVFLVAVPVMVLLLALGPLLLPEFRNADAGRLDFPSAFLSLAAVLLIIHGLKQVAHDGFAWLPLLTIAAGSAVGMAFVRRQRRLSDPLVDLTLFRIPAFSAALTVNTLTFFVNFGVFLFVAQYLQLVLGLSPWNAGLWTAPSYLGFVVGSLLTPAIVRHLRRSTVASAGLALAAIGLVILTRVDGPSSLLVLVVGSTVFALGLAAPTTLATDIIVGNAPPERAGAAAAISETSSEFGGALGIALLGSVGAGVYRGGMLGENLTGLPPHVIEAARDTFAATVAAASRFVDRNDALEATLASSRQAFERTFEVVAITGSTILVATAILSLLILRRAESQ